MRTGWMVVTLAALAAAAPAALAAQDQASEMAHDHGDVGAAIEAATEAFVNAYNAGDAAGVAALYAEDATVMPPNAEPAVGREAIEAAMRAELDAAPGFSLVLETTSLEVTGDVAVELGRYVVTDPEGGHADHGSFIAYWKRVDGGWKMAADIWNSSMPAM